MNPFQNSTKNLPKSDPQIVRIGFEQSEVAGRKSHLPKEDKSPDLTIKHVQNQS